VVGFFRGHRGATFASSALMDPISKGFVAAVHRFCRDRGVPLVEFVKGQRKDDVAAEHLARFAGAEGVLFVGRAQEKTRVFRTEKRRNPVTGASYPWIVSGLWGSETLIAALTWASALRKHPARDVVRGLSTCPSVAGAGRPARPVRGE
jgi:hypothetical protein